MNRETIETVIEELAGGDITLEVAELCSNDVKAAYDFYHED